MAKQDNVGKKEYFAYGIGNFASQLSWTMVSTYLSIFYTDVFGLAPSAIAVLFLVAKIWDGCNDPMMGAVMQRTNTKWGRFRPYIVIGSVFLVAFTILTFTVPGFGSRGKLIYAYITYIGLGMSYTMTNVPYQGMPAVMTRDPHKINRLNGAQVMGMMVGMTVLNLVTLPLVNYFNGIKKNAGYQYTAIVFAVIALLLFWYCAKTCKEVVVVEKEYQPPIKESLKYLFTSKNMIMVILYDCLVIMGAMGRIAIAVYFYLYVANTGALTSIYMMLPMFMGIILTPFAPILTDKFGKRNVTLATLGIQSLGLLMMVVGPNTNLVYLFICTVIYGIGALKEPALPGMLVDALDEVDLKTGVRPDGIAFSLLGLGNKIGSAIGSAVGVAVIGWFGYTGGENITAHIQSGITISVNVFPVVVFVLSAIPVFFYNLNEEKMQKIRQELDERNEKRAQKAQAE